MRLRLRYSAIVTRRSVRFRHLHEWQEEHNTNTGVSDVQPRIHYWSSPSGNTAALAQKLHTPTHRINGDIGTWTILMFPTYDSIRRDDYIPKQVREWAAVNSQWIIGVIACGNRNFGMDFCRGGYDLARCLNIPVLYSCELMGTPTDVTEIDTGIRQHWETLIQLRHPTPAT